MKALLSTKIGMTSITDEQGKLQPVTLLSIEPNVVTQVKTADKDGYSAVQVGTKYAKKLSKAAAGRVKKSQRQPKVLREFIISEESSELKIGDELNADLFNVGDIVSVSSTSKGKGFAGTIKRHNMKRGPKTHGGRSYRRIGSIGSMYPQKIFKGKRMAGHMGHERVTIKNLKVVLIDMENKVIGVSGAVPGPRKGLVEIKGASK